MLIGALLSFLLGPRVQSTGQDNITKNSVQKLYQNVLSFADDNRKAKLEPEIKAEQEPETVKHNTRDENSTDDDEDKLVIKDESLGQDENDGANASTASSCDYNLAQFKKDESQFEQSEVDENESMDQTQEEEKEEKFKPKVEDHSDEDMPLSARVSSTKRKLESDEDDDVPLIARKKIKKEPKVKQEKAKKKKKRDFDEEDELDYKPEKKAKKEKKTKVKIEVKEESPKKGGRKKKETEEPEVWKW